MPALRQSPLWCDAVGSVNSAIHHDPFPNVGVTRPEEGDPLKAGPGINYQPYVGLQEWEALTSRLAREQMPIKRRQLRDYAASPEALSPTMPAATLTADSAAAGAAALEAASSLPAAVEAMVLTPPTQSSSSSAAPRAAFAAEAEPRALQSDAPLSGSSGSPLHPTVTFAQTHESFPPQAAQQPRLRVRVPRPGASSSTSTPRMPSGEAPASKITLLKMDEAQPGEVWQLPLQQLDLQVNKVNPQHCIDSELNARAKPLPRKVVSQEQAYAAHQLRPARERNVVCRQRISELVDKAALVRVGAKDKHPSRSFESVPSANLRVI
eukprot:TRINITY_DN29426_c0_g2_i1.p1 TRINITY_DN29426_c0_g2~~TRINITY_DN29426_c0_g2_i1.p1  ORF type:complete len:323 (-),score=80.50 TRINITY_DN29426_c0_g2_i1:261-1229(-)